MIKGAFNPLHDQFLRFMSRVSKDYLHTNKLHEFIDMQQRVINMREDKTKKEACPRLRGQSPASDVVKKACNEFNIKKVFNN
jgi:ABC-type Fe3+/spermidine/putrescine transport system ATPase subunit